MNWKTISLLIILMFVILLLGVTIISDLNQAIIDFCGIIIIGGVVGATIFLSMFSYFTFPKSEKEEKSNDHDSGKN